MKSPDKAFEMLVNLSDKRQWSLTWVESNWNSSYDIGYEDGQATLTGHIKSFRDEGSLARAEYGWFWYPYLMGYRDGRGTRWED